MSFYVAIQVGEFSNHAAALVSLGMKPEAAESITQQHRLENSSVLCVPGPVRVWLTHGGSGKSEAWFADPEHPSFETEAEAAEFMRQLIAEDPEPGRAIFFRTYILDTTSPEA